MKIVLEVTMLAKMARIHQKTDENSIGMFRICKSRTALYAIGIALLFSSLACNLGAYLDDSSRPDGVGAGGEMDLEAALAIPLEDRRSVVLDQMGGPDVFSIQFQELAGQVVRTEQWSYLDYKARFDFIDGELLWTVDLEPVPDGSIYAHYYSPHDFSAYMTEAEVRALLSGQELLALDLAEAEIPGGKLLAGDQILLGFDQDQLVYVETLMLSPEVTQ